MTSPPPIAYYISGHGFGHAARERPIMKLLAEQSVQIHVRSSVPEFFFDLPNITYHQQRYDIGLIQPDALHVDVQASLQWYADFLGRQNEVIADEVRYLREHNIGLVISDMPPIAFDIAEKASIPSIAITNFTWDWIYEQYIHDLPDYTPVLKAIRDSYQKATLTLQMPFAHSFDIFPNVEPIPLVVTQPTKTIEQVRREMNVPSSNKVLLFSMGGHDLGEVDFSRLHELHDWTVLLPQKMENSLGDLHNCYFIPVDYRDYNNLIVASDIIVGKAGGSTVAEVIGHGKKMLYTLRENYRENELLQSALESFSDSQFVEKYEFQAGSWVSMIDSLANRKRQVPTIATNGAEVAANRILQMLSGGNHGTDGLWDTRLHRP